MKTRLVRRRRSLAPIWAVSALFPLLIAYLILGVPALERWREYAQSAPPTQNPWPTPAVQNASAERTTREVTIGGISLYLIQFGQYADASLARVEAARYVARGAAGYLYEGTRVIGAGYEALADAQKVASRLVAEEGLDVEVVPIESRTLTLRITATPAQIEALEAADRALKEASSALGAAALSLDRAEMTLSQTLAEVARLAQSVDGAYRALASQVGEPAGEIAQGFVDMLGTASQTLSLLSQEKPTSALAFSSKMKYNSIELRLMHIEFINQL